MSVQRETGLMRHIGLSVAVPRTVFPLAGLINTYRQQPDSDLDQDYDRQTNAFFLPLASPLHPPRDSAFNAEHSTTTTTFTFTLAVSAVGGDDGDGDTFKSLARTWCLPIFYLTVLHRSLPLPLSDFSRFGIRVA